MFDNCYSGCNMLWKKGSRADTRIWYEAWFIKICPYYPYPDKINLDKTFSASCVCGDMEREK